MAWIRSLAAGFVAVALAAAGANAAPVKTDLGLVEGVESGGITAYKGIPFAAPPVGDLRWKAPAPARPWSGVLKADHFALACIQNKNAFVALGLGPLETGEDCLYLNVWTPAKSAGEKLPVMVWIYGGGFTSGATSVSTYDGAALARRGVVLVSVSYRVGALGFLAHKELTAESGKGSGTYGMMDQIAALKWVQRNIAAFGGDPAKVTVFGESAGGIAVSMLTASPKAKGLFRAAISESGGNFGSARGGDEGGLTMPTLAKAEAQGAGLLAKLGVASIADARKIPAEAILAAGGPQLGGFWPALDGDVLPGDQYKLYEAGRYNDTPVLIGSNGDEGAIFVPRITADAYKTQINGGYGEKSGAVLAAYPAGSDAEALASARQLMGDTSFAWPTWTWARLQSRTGKGKAYGYVFIHHPPYPDLPLYKGVGAGHGAEIAYVFGNGDSGWKAEDQRVSDIVQGYWVNFAKTLDPNGPGLPAWPAFTEARPMMMELDATPQAVVTPHLEQLKVLEAYYAWRRGEAGR
jgi:para-nitrobenzyl esterase